MLVLSFARVAVCEALVQGTTLKAIEILLDLTF